MRHRSLVALALAVAAVAAPALAAEQAAAPPAPRMFVVHVENPLPSKLAQYESSTREFVQLLQQNRSALPSFGFQALQGEDLSFAYISPIRGFGDMDGILTGFDKIAKASGARWGDLMRRAGEATASIDEGVFMEIPGASYQPATARLKPEEERYFELDFYRVLPGMEDAARDIAMQWKALHERHAIAASYRVYQLVSGHDMPMVVVSIPAKDPADLAAVQATEEKELGQERLQMIEKTMALTRGFEVKRYWWRPDLSLMPPMAGATTR